MREELHSIRVLIKTHYDEVTKISDEKKKTGHIPGFGTENNDAEDVTTVKENEGGDK